MLPVYNFLEFKFIEINNFYDFETRLVVFNDYTLHNNKISNKNRSIILI